MIALLLVLTALNAAESVDLPNLAASAPIIVLAQVDDPRLDVQDLPLRDAKGENVAPFQRMRRHFRLVRTLKGQATHTLVVDEPEWQAAYAAAQVCARTGKCDLREPPRFQTTLSREPVPGSQVLVFLRRDGNAYALAAGFALDDASREVELRSLLTHKKRPNH